MMCDYWAPTTIVAQTLMGLVGEKVEEVEVIPVTMNAMDQDNGQPLFQIMTLEPTEEEKEVYVRSNPTSSKPHTIAKDGTSLPKGGGKGVPGNPGELWDHNTNKEGGKGTGGWTTAADPWKSTGWKTNKGWKTSTPEEEEEPEGSWTDHTRQEETNAWKNTQTREGKHPRSKTR